MKLDNLNLAGALTVTKNDLETKSVLKKLGTIYDEHAKLVFLFDVSGSMRERIATGWTDQYVWTPEQLGKIRLDVQAAVAKANQRGAADGGEDDEDFEDIGAPAPVSLSAEEYDLIKLADNGTDATGNLFFTCADDEELKERIVRRNLIIELNIPLDLSKEQKVPPTRLEAVKQLAAKEIHARFSRFPKSRVAMLRFASHSEVLFDDGTHADIDGAIERLNFGCGGGTDILCALNDGMQVCKKRPSEVGLHHFIVVSDGEDYKANANIVDWILVLKTSGVVLDYIHIGDSPHNDGMKTACAALGGEFVAVNSARDLESKLFNAVTRMIAPPVA